MDSAILNEVVEGVMGYFASSNKTPVICDTVKALESFEAPKYMGNWYEIQHVTGEGF